jgi:alpha-tubulin suppressor-like RCC1 family protein
LQVSAGGSHSCGITTDNRVYCWGDNDFGQLGDGSTTGHRRPTAVATTLRFRQISANYYGTCALTTDDRLFCWGSVASGSQNSSPQRVGSGLHFRQISASGEHACAVGRDDELAYCWGLNTYGQLGDGTTSNRTNPVPVAGNLHFGQLAGGERHTCGMTTDNRIYCWGSNRWGQIGDGSSSSAVHLEPSRVAGTLRYANVTAGRLHTCAVSMASKAFCWGDGRSGQIGDGKTILRFKPQAVAGGLTFRRLTGGYNHTCGVTTSNKGYCWGGNFYGALGDGSADPTPTAFSSVPVAVVGGLVFQQLATGTHFTCGTTTENVGYCWGYNAGAQLGDGTTTNRDTPGRIAAPM